MDWDESSPLQNYYNNFPIVLEDIECLDGQSPRQDFAMPLPSMLSPFPEGPTSNGLSPSMTHPNSSELVLEPQESTDSLELGVTNKGSFNAKAMLLTYSQAPQLSREQILEHLISLNNQSVQLLGAVIGQEHHVDQGIHYHAAIQWTSSRTWRPSMFDVNQVHPNIRTHRKGKSTFAESLMRMWKYPQKEDTTPLKWGVEPSLKRSRNQIAQEAIGIAETQSVESALSYLKESQAMELVKNYHAIERSLTAMSQKAKRTKTEARPLPSFKPNIIASIPDELKSLYIWGPSGKGKTQLARALLPEALVISHTDQLRGCDFSKGVIFDDFGVSHWPVTAVIHLVDWEVDRGINVKHGHVVIPAHTRKIFTYNNCIEYWMPSNASPEQQIAVKRRLDELELKAKCYL